MHVRDDPSARPGAAPAPRPVPAGDVFHAPPIARCAVAAGPPSRPGGAPPPRRKPNPLPMRLAIGAGGMAALSALVVAIAGPTAARVDAAAAATTAPGADSPDAGPFRAIVRTVVLQPGQSAPDGSLVVPVAKPQPTQQQRVKIVTCQSGVCK